MGVGHDTRVIVMASGASGGRGGSYLEELKPPTRRVEIVHPKHKWLKTTAGMIQQKNGRRSAVYIPQYIVVQ